MRFLIDFLLRFNMIIAIIVLRSFYEIKRSLTFLNVNEIDIRIDASQFKQNEIKVTVIIALVKIYAEVKISAKNIVILTKYTTQVQLLKKSLALNSKVRDVKAYTINSFQGEKASVVILCMMKIRKFNFMFILNRFLTACSRARDSFVMLCNFNKL